VRAVLDDGILQRPGLLTRQFEIQVGVIDTTAHDLVHDLGQAPGIEAGGREDHPLGNLE